MKYALLRRPLRVFPFAKPIAQICREIDAARGLSFRDKVTREDVFRWQHENLIQMLEEIGAQYE